MTPELGRLASLGAFIAPRSVQNLEIGHVEAELVIGYVYRVSTIRRNPTRLNDAWAAMAASRL